jgi:hypothetical protein
MSVAVTTTKNIGRHSDKYYGKISFGTDGSVGLIELKKHGGDMENPREETFTLQGKEAVLFLKTLTYELEAEP